MKKSNKLNKSYYITVTDLRVAIFWQAQPLFFSKKRIKRIIYIYQLVFISILGIQFSNESIPIDNAKLSLPCWRQLPEQCISKLSIVMHYQLNQSTSQPIKRPYGFLQQLLLIVSGAVKINPGPVRL